MKRILIVGCGDIAVRVAALLKARYRLFGLARRADRFVELRSAGIAPLAGDLDDRSSLAHIAGLADVVLHFAPPPSSPPMTKRGREGLAVDTRTRNLLAALSLSIPPSRLIYISTSSVYGDCGGVRVSETHPLNPQAVRAQCRVNAERQIRNWAKRHEVSASILRVPGIYAADRLPLERLRAGIPAIIHEEDSYTNHIHADDLVHIVVAALRNGKPNRLYQTCDDSEIKMGDYFDAVANACGLPRPPRLPREEVMRAVSPSLWSFMSESRRLTNERMKNELKVKLRYPSVADALRSVTSRC